MNQGAWRATIHGVGHDWVTETFTFFWVCPIRLPWWLSSQEPTCQCRRCRFDPWTGRSSGGGNGNLLQESCLGIPMGLQRVGPELGTKQVASLGHVFLLLQISSPNVLTTGTLFIFCVPPSLGWDVCLKTDSEAWNLWCHRRSTRPDLAMGTSQRSWGSLSWGEFFGFAVHPSDSLPLAEGYGCFLFSISHLTAMWCSGPLAQILRNKEEIHLFILTTHWLESHDLIWEVPSLCFLCYMKLTCFWNAGWRLIGLRAFLPLMQESVEVFLCIFHLGHLELLSSPSWSLVQGIATLIWPVKWTWKMDLGLISARPPPHHPRDRLPLAASLLSRSPSLTSQSSQ